MPNPHETHHDFLQNWEVLSLLHVTRRFHEWREVFTSDATHSHETRDVTRDDSRQVRGAFSMLRVTLVS